MINLIVAGSRSFNDYAMLSRYLNSIHEKYVIAKIIQGECSGADLLAKRWAIENNIAHDDCPADWDNLDVTPCKVKYNKRGKPYNALAGFTRNHQMVDDHEATHFLAFRVNMSPGTTDGITYAKEKGLKVMVVDL